MTERHRRRGWAWAALALAGLVVAGRAGLAQGDDAPAPSADDEAAPSSADHQGRTTSGDGATADLAALALAAGVARTSPPPPPALPHLRVPDLLAPALAVPQPPFPVLAEGFVDEPDLPPQVGRVVTFSRAGTGYLPQVSCSGAVVAPDLVLTAAHCVVGYDAWSFSAALFGDHDRGTWVGTTAAHAAEYDHLGPEAPQLDYALVRLLPGAGGERPGDVVGTLPVATDAAEASLRRRAIGYPAEGTFAASCPGAVCRPWACEADQAQLVVWPSGRRQMGWGCTASGGMSGGPALADPEGDGAPAVISVSSTIGLVVPDDAGGRAFGLNLWGPELRGRDYAALLAALA